MKVKSKILKTVSVIAAFIIGISVNNSCGESDDTGNPSTYELWQTIHTLSAEISHLKNDIQQLRTEVENIKQPGGSDHGEILIDGLYFSRSGFVKSKPKKSYDLQSQNMQSTEYVYDSKGHLKTIISHNNGSTTTTSFEYSGKTRTETTNTIYDPAYYPNSQNYSTKSVTEYF